MWSHDSVPSFLTSNWRLGLVFIWWRFDWLCLGHIDRRFSNDAFGRIISLIHDCIYCGCLVHSHSTLCLLSRFGFGLVLFVGQSRAGGPFGHSYTSKDGLGVSPKVPVRTSGRPQGRLLTTTGH